MANRLADVLAGNSATLNFVYNDEYSMGGEYASGPYGEPFQPGDRLTGNIVFNCDGSVEQLASGAELWLLVTESQPYPNLPVTVYAEQLIDADMPFIQNDTPIPFDIEAPVTSESVAIYLAASNTVESYTSGDLLPFPEGWASEPFNASVTITVDDDGSGSGCWVPVHLSGIEWSFDAGDIDSGDLSVDGSHVIGVGVTSTAGPGPAAISLPVGTRFRLTVEEFSQDNPNPTPETPSGQYRVTRPAFNWYEDGSEVYEPNVAAPFDVLENGDEWPAVAGAYEWAPNPAEGVVDDMPETGPVVQLYAFGRYETPLSNGPLPTDFNILVEVWDENCGQGPDPEPGVCFWTDLVGVAEDCGGEEPEPNWIPIHTSDAYYSLSANSEGTNMVDSTIITDIAFGDCNWALHFGTPEPPGGRVRVTVNITSVTGENSLLLFQYTLGSGSNDGVVMNEHPDSTTFEPSTFVVEIVPNGEQFYLQLTAFDTTGLTATYFIEIEG